MLVILYWPPSDWPILNSIYIPHSKDGIVRRILGWGSMILNAEGKLLILGSFSSWMGKSKNTLTCHSGTIRFWRMPCILTKAPNPFKRTLVILLTGFNWCTYVIYLHDMIPRSMSFGAHLMDIDMVLFVLCKAEASLNLKNVISLQRVQSGWDTSLCPVP